jgi:transcriptional regulator with XRE-family HTH domain
VNKAERKSKAPEILAERQKIGELIRRKRKERGLTLLDMQAQTKIGNGNLSRIERGHQALSNITRARLAKILCIPIIQLTELGTEGPLCETPLFSDKMRTHRTSQGITLVDLHEMTGIEPVRLLKLERAEVSPEEREVRSISVALGIGS